MRINFRENPKHFYIETIMIEFPTFTYYRKKSSNFFQIGEQRNNFNYIEEFNQYIFRHVYMHRVLM